MNLKSIYRIRRKIEQGYPIGLALIVFAGLNIIRPVCLNNIWLCSQLANPYLTIFSISFGFIFASLSTLLSLSDKPFIRGMQEAGSFMLLIKYHWSCVRWCSVGTLLGIAALFWPESWYQSIQGSIFIAIGVGALSSTLRILSLFAKVIHHVSSN